MAQAAVRRDVLARPDARAFDYFLLLLKESNMREKKNGTAADRIRRIAALAGVVLLVGLYVVTFILAVAGNENSSRLLHFCFGMTIFVPIFIWVVTWCAGVLFHKKTFASVNLLNSDPEERRRMEEAVARQMDTEGHSADNESSKANRDAMS